MQIINGTVFTVEQAIRFLIFMGHSGAERQLESFLKNGKLTSNNQYNALIKGLERFAGIVEKKGRGKNVTLTLSDVYDSPLEQSDGRTNNKRKPTEEDLVLDEYIFNMLLELDKREALPTNTWANKMELFDLTPFSNKENKKRLIQAIADLHSETLAMTNDVAKLIVEIFKQSMRNRRKSVVENAFKRLEEQGRITTSVRYFVHTLNSSYKEITEEQSNKIKLDENIILTEFGMTRKEYVHKKIYSSDRDDNYYSIHSKVNEKLARKYRIKYHYEGVKVQVLDETVIKDVREIEKDEAFFSRLFALTESKANRNDYLESTEIYKEWYVLNTYTLLKELGEPFPTIQYEKELERLKKAHSMTFQFDRELQNQIDDATSIFNTIERSA